MFQAREDGQGRSRCGRPGDHHRRPPGHGRSRPDVGGLACRPAAQISARRAPTLAPRRARPTPALIGPSTVGGALGRLAGSAPYRAAKGSGDRRWVMRFSRALAIAFGLLAPLAETVRRWHTWREYPPAIAD